MSKVTIAIPSPLREYTAQNKKVKVEGRNIQDAIQNLVNQFPKLKTHLYEGNDLRNYVNIYLNDEDVRYLDNKIETELCEGDEVAIIPSIAGGII